MREVVDLEIICTGRGEFSDPPLLNGREPNNHGEPLLKSSDN